MVHSFTLVLEDLDDLTDEQAERIFEAGCDDCTPGVQGDTVLLDFDREAGSRQEAIASAVEQLKRIGMRASLL